MLIILVGALFLGGSAVAAGSELFTGWSSSERNDAMKKSVDDRPRLDAASEVVESFEHDADGFIERELAEQDGDTETTAQKILAYRFELRGHLSAEEWEKVFPAPAPQK